MCILCVYIYICTYVNVFMHTYLLCSTIYVRCPCQTDMIIAMSAGAYVKCQQLAGTNIQTHTYPHTYLCLYVKINIFSIL